MVEKRHSLKMIFYVFKVGGGGTEDADIDFFEKFCEVFLLAMMVPRLATPNTKPASYLTLKYYFV